MRLKMYLLIIALCLLMDSLYVCLAFDVSYFYALLFGFVFVIAVIIVDGLTAAICRMLPRKVTDIHQRLFPVSKKEKAFYNFLKIKKWKDKIPEIGHLTGFRKNKIEDKKNPQYFARFIYESSYGEIGHFFSVITGFIIVFFSFNSMLLHISIFVSIINGLLNILPIIVLRYNKYTLVIVYNKLLKHQNLQTNN